MKFKSIFLIFNAIIIFSFLFISLLPLLMLGVDYAAPFWQQSWYLLVVFFLILGGLDWYFLRNWKLFGLLEKEDWDGLREYIEHEIYEKGKLRDQQVMILLNTYVVKGRTEGILRLEKHLATEAPAMRRKLAVQLGMYYLMTQDSQGQSDFFGEFVSTKGVTQDGWVDWLWAFARHRLGDAEAAGETYLKVFSGSRDEFLKALSLYMMKNVLGEESKSGVFESFSVKFRKRYSPASWAKKIESRKEQLHVLALSRIIQDAGEYILDAKEPIRIEGK